MACGRFADEPWRAFHSPPPHREIKKPPDWEAFLFHGGEGGIRTLVTLSGKHAFEEFSVFLGSFMKTET